MKGITSVLGFGLVGVGAIAHNHALAIKALSAKHNLRLVGYSVDVMEKTRQFAQQHDIPFHTDNPEAFFANPKSM